MFVMRRLLFSLSAIIAAQVLFANGDPINWDTGPIGNSRVSKEVVADTSGENLYKALDLAKKKRSQDSVLPTRGSTPDNANSDSSLERLQFELDTDDYLENRESTISEAERDAVEEVDNHLEARAPQDSWLTWFFPWLAQVPPQSRSRGGNGGSAGQDGQRGGGQFGGEGGKAGSRVGRGNRLVINQSGGHGGDGWFDFTGAAGGSGDDDNNGANGGDGSWFVWGANGQDGSKGNGGAAGGGFGQSGQPGRPGK